MIYEEFLDGLAGGSYQSDLTSCQLMDGYGNKYNGQGRLEWNAADGIRITATTDGAEQLKKRIGKAPCLPGTILPTEYFLKLTGKTLDKWDVSVDRVAPAGHDFHFDTAEVVWRFSNAHVLSDVEWTREVGISRHFVDFLLWPANLPMWPRDSKKTYDNPIFHRESTSKDWLNCTPATGIVAARRLDDEKIYVRADCNQEDQQPKIVRSIALALSYLMGKATNVLGYQSIYGNRMRRVLPAFRIEPKRNVISPPLGTSFELTGCFEAFLEKAIEFFSTEEGEEVGNLLYACWDAADNTFTTQTIVVCTVVESLVNKLAAGEEVAIPLTEQQSAGLTNFVENSGFSEAFTKRLAGFLTNINAVNVKNMLHKWAEQSKIGITVEDATAWSSLRNAAAHGHRLTGGNPDKRHDQIRKRYRVETLINRLVLSMMKYEGRFHDATDWQFKPFPK